MVREFATARACSGRKWPGTLMISRTAKTERGMERAKKNQSPKTRAGTKTARRTMEVRTLVSMERLEEVESLFIL